MGKKKHRKKMQKKVGAYLSCLLLLKQNKRKNHTRKKNAKE